MTETPGLAIQVGDFIAAKYRVERVLGAGAMGVVVAALHLDLQEVRAIKLMLPSALSDAEAVERFLREARAAARLKSDHVAKIYDVGRLETGSPYIVIELLDGVDLKTVLEREPMLSPQRAARYVMQACDAVGEAHTLGIVHRDLKPANLFLTTGPRGEERVKVLDFGIAKMADPAGGVEMTRTTAILGTPLYMSPEQMRAARNADARSDVWALGVVLYRMLTGKVPFLGSTITEVCSAVISDIPDPPRAVRPDLPPGLEAVILRCLEKSPAARFANASELGAALAPFAASAAAAAAPGSLGSTMVMDPPSAAGLPQMQAASQGLHASQGLAASQGFNPSQGLAASQGFNSSQGLAASQGFNASQGRAASQGYGQPPVPPQAPPVGNTTQSTSWTQPAASSTGAASPASTGIVPPRPTSRVPLVIGAVALAAVFLGGGAWAASRFLFTGPATPSEPATAAAPDTATATATAAPTAAPTVEPAAAVPATATPTATATPGPTSTTVTPGPAASASSVVKPATTPSTKAQPTVKPPSAGKSCDPPYVVDIKGHRRMKPECL